MYVINRRSHCYITKREVLYKLFPLVLYNSVFLKVILLRI